jgi:2-dehydropantoate 2-reductase
MRWKYNKLLMNLGNAVEALTGSRPESIVAAARREARACLDAAGIDYVSDQEEKARRADHLQHGDVPGRKREGGSTWQSLQRGTHRVETEYFNGEIVLLGRLHRIPTPVNALLQRLVNELAWSGAAPGGMSVEALLREITRETRSAHSAAEDGMQQRASGGRVSNSGDNAL